MRGYLARQLFQKSLGPMAARLIWWALAVYGIYQLASLLGFDHPVTKAVAALGLAYLVFLAAFWWSEKR